MGVQKKKEMGVNTHFYRHTNHITKFQKKLSKHFRYNINKIIISHKEKIFSSQFSSPFAVAKALTNKSYSQRNRILCLTV